MQRRQHAPTLAVVLVNYNNEDDTIACLETLANQTLDDFLTVVVDNGSESGSFERITDRFEYPTYLKNDENEGFTGGNNRGIEYSLEAGADWILLLNNDTEIEPDFLESFLGRVACLPPDVGVANPLIHTYDSREVWSAGGMVNTWTGRTTNRTGPEEAFDRSERVDYAIGAALLVHANVFEEIGLLDDEFFIYYEETEFCRRAAAAGWSVWFLPVRGVYHKETVEYNHSAFREYYFTRNRWLFETKTQSLPTLLVFCPYYLVRWLAVQVLYLSLVKGDGSAARATLRGAVDAILGRTGRRHA